MVERTEQFAELNTHSHILRRFIKPQSSNVVQVFGEFGGKSFAEHFNGSSHFLNLFFNACRLKNKSKQLLWVITSTNIIPFRGFCHISAFLLHL